MKYLPRKIVLFILFYLIIFFVVGEIITRLYIYYKYPDEDFKFLLNKSRYMALNSSKNPISLAGLVRVSDNDRIIYELKPNIEGYFVGKYVKVNSQGLRDYEYSKKKPPNTFRIVGIGDSVMFGWGVDMEESYLKILERKLNQMNSTLNYEVINFAVPGYNAVMEVETFKEKAMEYEPDLVIVGFIGNDFFLPNFIKKQKEYKTLRKSAFIDFVLTKIINMMDTNSHNIPDDLNVPAGLESVPTESLKMRLLEVPEEYKYMVGWSAYSDSMKQLSELTKSANIKTIQVTYNNDNMSYYDDLYDLWKEQDFDYILFPWGFFEVIKNKSLRISESDIHPSPLGHKLIAEKLFFDLINQSLVPIN